MDSSCLFLPEELLAVDFARVPHHVAIIPDGNRRWAELREAPAYMGHRCGADGLLEIVKGAKQLGIGTLTFYAFSTENWLRASEEVDALMLLLESYLAEQCAPMCEHGVRFYAIGELERLPKSVRDALTATQVATARGEAIDFILALNYGGRNELCRAMQRIAADCLAGKCSPQDIDEVLIATYLDTGSWVDPDLLIRTSGEHRVSNFLLWQISYAEIYFSEVLWPDFTPKHLLQAVLDYQRRQRRGGV